MILKVQAWSGLLFAIFLVVHLLNTWLAGLGLHWYDCAQQLAGRLYQWLPLEVALLGAVAAHLSCALVRWRMTAPAGRARGKISLRQRLHRYCGMFLMVAIGGHIAAVRLIPGWHGIRPEAAGIAFTFQFLPQFFYPYYLAFAAAGFYHMVSGAALAMPRLGFRLGFRLPLSTPWLYRLSALAVALTLVALLGFGGRLYPVADARDAPFARLLQEIIGEPSA